MKNLQSLKGAKTLTKHDQQIINGGKKDLCEKILCVPEKICVNGRCIPRP